MRLTQEAYEAVVAQARAELPNEACGYLLGNGDVVTQNYPMTNADKSPEHFSIVPSEQFAALRYARANGLKIIANWHSHPSTPSRPSAEDIRLAFDPTIAYFILSLAEEEPVFNAFWIKDGEVQKIEYSL